MLKRELDQMKRRGGELRDQAVQNKVGVPRLTTSVVICCFLDLCLPSPSVALWRCATG